MADLAKIRYGFGKLDDTVASWRVAVMTKMANKTKIVKPASNGENGESGENRQRAGENFNEITRGAPCKDEKLTKMRNVTKMENLVKIENLAKVCHGFGKYSNWIPKVTLGEWRF